jgi:UDP-glucose 4-epimerase
MQINGKRILVTGGAGLIGSTTIDLLLREHDPGRIVILDNMSRGAAANIEQALKDRRVQLVDGDIRDRALVDRLAAEADANRARRSK